MESRDNKNLDWVTKMTQCGNRISKRLKRVKFIDCFCSSAKRIETLEAGSGHLSA